MFTQRDEHSFVNFYVLIIAEKNDLSTQMFTKFDFLVLIFGLCSDFGAFFCSDTLYLKYMKKGFSFILAFHTKIHASFLLNITKIKLTKKSENIIKIW